jgi:PAS domain S-box-containing protein
VLPGPRPRPELKPFRTRGLVRRVAPFLVIAAVFAIQASTSAGPLLVFPLYLTVVLLAALHLSRADSLAAAGLAGIAILSPSLTKPGVWALIDELSEYLVILVRQVHRGGSSGLSGGDPLGDTAAAVFLAAVLMVAGAAVHEVVAKAREAAADASAVQASEERLRLTLEAVQVGLALVGKDGRWIQVNETLCAILGRGRDELLTMTLAQVTAENDQAALDEALAMLRSGDILRWEAQLFQMRGDGIRVPIEITIAALSDHRSGDFVMLVQEADVSTRKRLEGL